MTSAYIYGLWDPRDGRLRYIGKSVDPEKRLRDHLKESRGSRRNNHNYNWIRQLLSESLEPLLEILEETTLDDWKDVEREWIKQAKNNGLKLTNRTDGGEGVSSYTNENRIFSEEYRQRLSQANKGKKRTAEQRQNISASHKGLNKGNKFALGHKHTEETKQRISKTLRAHPNRPFLGKTLSEEHRRKISIAGKGRIHSAESIAKMREKLTGLKRTESTRRRISLARRRSHRESQIKAGQLDFSLLLYP